MAIGFYHRTHDMYSFHYIINCAVDHERLDIYFDADSCCMFMFFASLRPGTSIYRKIYGKNGKVFDGELLWHIVIEGDTISAEGVQRSETRSIGDIKKVVDMGNCYKVYFYFPHKSNIFLCQKDLITQGTIEEFENMFSEAIQRVL